MPNKTTNYQLNQWEPEDSFLRTDFNEDNAKIEAALTEMARGSVKVITGTYTGTGGRQEINLGFQPSAVFIYLHDGTTGYSDKVYGGLLLSGQSIYSTTGAGAAGMTETGFWVTLDSGGKCYTSVSGRVYRYLALKW